MTDLLIDEKTLCGLWPPSRAVIIGCGGIGSNLWDLIAHQTYYSAKLANQGYMTPHLKKFLLVDGDSVEPKNLFRQSFLSRHVGMSKAEALCDKYYRQLGEFGVEVEHKREWLTENSDFINNQDIILLGVDNNASRKILNDLLVHKKKKIKNVIAVNGGNDDTLVTVQVMVITKGKVVTASFEHLHPEISNPDDKHPRHVECTSAEGMADDPQVFRSNQHAADLMFNIYQNALEARYIDYCGIWSNVGDFSFRKEDIPDKEVIVNE